MRWTLLLLVGALLVPIAGAAADAGELYDAALTGNVDTVRRLVAGGADVSDPGDLGTPLHAAAFRGDTVIAEILINKGPDINAKQDYSGDRPLHVAASYDQPEFVVFLLARGAEVDAVGVEEMTPLLIAVRLGNTAVAELLLDKGADVNVVDNVKLTPLHLAVRTDKRDLIQLVLNHRPDVNASSTNNGETPLHVAAAYASPDVIELLVTPGAALESKMRDGRTPLMRAQGDGRNEAAAMLRKLGATK